MRAPARTNVRMRLIQAAVNLAYQHGFGNTSLADIAKEAKVPPGNLYYYFKTKEEIAGAIVEQRLSELLAMQQELGKIEDPRERLCSLVLMWLKNQDVVVKYGCPVGTFCTELNKDGGSPAQKASKIFAGLLAWVEAQFKEFSTKGEARGHALHLVSVLQGVTVLANCSKIPDLIEMESRRLVGWIRSL
jgi:TetR/AcrR family transcriptional regulator, transcriptional repressor for nem operon